MSTLSNGTNGVLSNGHPSSWQAKHDVASHFIGGNHLDAAPASAVKDFVQKSDGHSVITSVSYAVSQKTAAFK
jgi:acetyl-CoA carboxylase / biotin carboxylase 1